MIKLSIALHFQIVFFSVSRIKQNVKILHLIDLPQQGHTDDVTPFTSWLKNFCYRSHNSKEVVYVYIIYIHTKDLTWKAEEYVQVWLLVLGI